MNDLPALTVHVDAQPMKVLSVILRDPNPIHFDVEAVKRLGLGDQPVNQGPMNLSYVINMLAAWCGSHAAIRDIKVRFLANVFAGDRVIAGGQVRKREGDTIECDVWLDIEGRGRAIEGTAVICP